MGWLKLDDGFLDHPKVAGLTDRQLRHHLAAMLYAARFRTDGHLPAAALKTLRVPQKHQDLLVDNGLWDRDPETNELSIHDFSVYNSATIEAKVAAFLDGNPDASASEVHRVVGGRKSVVLALVQEIRGSATGTGSVPGNQGGTGTRSVPRARDTRAGGPAPPQREITKAVALDLDDEPDIGGTAQVKSLTPDLRGID